MNQFRHKRTREKMENTRGEKRGNFARGREIGALDHDDNNMSDSSEDYSVDFNFADDIKVGVNKFQESATTLTSKEVPAASISKLSLTPFPPLPKQKAEPEPVIKLDCPRFRDPEVGSTLKLRLINQRICEACVIPLFELAELSEQYENMGRQMSQCYQMLSSEPVLRPSQIHKGNYAVLMDSDGSTFHRIRFLADPSKDSVKIEMLDSYVIKTVDIRSRFLYLQKSFATLAPRVTAIEMDGMSYYLNCELFRQYLSHKSEHFLFDGELSAVVQPNGKVVVYSDLIPHTYPYGINGCIVSKFIGRLQEPKLPSLLGRKGNVYVVHAEPDGVVSIQMESAVANHFRELFNSIPAESIPRLKGTVKLGQIEDKNEKYFAPSQSDGVNYRAIIASQVDDDKVHVKFIDYGDEATVKIADLVLCRDVHPLLEMFPPQCVKVQLDNIKKLDSSIYFRKYHCYDEPYSIQVVKEGAKDSLTEVLLWAKEGKKCINEKIIDEKLADPINSTYEPEKAKEYSDRWLRGLNLYLLLTGGRRLKPDMNLEVKVSYEDSMANMFFITPTEHYSRFRKFEDDIEKEYNLPWNTAGYYTNWVKGNLMLCKSRALGHVARALLVEKKIVKGKQEEQQQQMHSSGTAWEAYLIDYGIYETIPASSFRIITSQLSKVSVFGVRATCEKYDIPEKIMEWPPITSCRRISVVVQSVDKDRWGEIIRVMVKSGNEPHLPH